LGFSHIFVFYLFIEHAPVQSMETQLTLTVLASLTVLMTFTVPIRCMNSPVFAGDDDNDKDKDKNYTVIKSTVSTTNHPMVSD
jgi:hypothetical protein